MMTTPSHPPLLPAVLVASLLLAACARSGIDEADLDAALGSAEASVEEPDADEPEAEDAEIPGIDAGPPLLYDAGVQDTGEAQEHDAAPLDAAAPASDAGHAEGGSPEAGVPPDAAPAADAAADAAHDAAADAAPDAAAPDAGPSCTPGTYKGEFLGTVAVNVFGIPLGNIAISGDITIVLPAGSGRVALQSGRVTGLDDENNPLEADVTGELDCSTGTVENGKLANGKYTRPLIGEVTFTGNVTGHYAYVPPGANGAWETTQSSTDLLTGGHGTWSVTRVP